MSRTPWPALALLAVLAACGERPAPTATDDLAPSLARTAPAAREQLRLERLALRLARALHDPAFRSRLRGDLERSPFAERKLQFQRFLTAGERPALTEVARLNDESAEAVGADALGAIPLELYLPVPAHRSRWAGEPDLLVATAIRDGQPPVAFDTRGRRQVLSAAVPPDTPVLALVPAETDFDRAPGAVGGAGSVCAYGAGAIGAQCSGGVTGGTISGLYMTASHLNGTFEGWLKGSPEIEVLVLGQKGATDSLTKYQCIGERVAAPYSFNQDAKEWSGAVLMFSQAQLDAYKAQHAGQAVRLFFMEDDDTSCELRNSNASIAKLIGDVDAATRGLSGGRDSTSTLLQRIWKFLAAGQKLWAVVASFINSNDDMIGNAVEDVTVGENHPGYNWIIRGENNVTNGWIKLEMR
ncbi:MAG TPA: hypothetical protein VFU46_02920 [Gemmatimonadales bacterium]|nr:hypothetical protein [Gemmatimonadales bacterium]